MLASRYWVFLSREQIWPVLEVESRVKGLAGVGVRRGVIPPPFHRLRYLKGGILPVPQCCLSLSRLVSSDP